MSSLGKYRVVRPLASGGMSELFLARQMLADDRQRAVVVKRLLRRLVEVPAQLAMFVNEGRILASLDHPNIVNVFELGTSATDYYLIMEYLRGVPLEELLKEAHAEKMDMPLDLVVHVVERTCAALEHVHNKTDELGQPLGLVHRDLNAGNLMITFLGEVKLVDFGLAKMTTSPDATRGGELKGTYAYMSPEQCQGGQLDARSDLFSLGVMLYELCCRRRLFRRNNEFSTIRAILEDPIPPPSEVNSEVPPALEAVLLKALSRPPEERFQDAAEMAGALKEAATRSGWTGGKKELAEFMDSVLAAKWEASGKTPYGAELPTMDMEGEGEDAGMVLELEALPPELKIKVAADGEQVDMEFAPMVADEEDEPVQPMAPSTPAPAKAAKKPAAPGKSTQGLVTTLKVDRPSSLSRAPKRGRRLPVILAVTLVMLIVVAGSLFLFGRKDLLGSPTTSISLSSTPPGATVYLNGVRFHGVTPLPLNEVSYDRKNNLVLVLAGHEPWQKTFTLKRGDPPTAIQATLVASENMAGKALIVISTDPAGAKVYLDGELRGKSDLELPGVESSKEHTLVLKLDGYKDKSITLDDLKPEESRMMEVKLEEQAPIDTKGKAAPRGGGGAAEPGDEDAEGGAGLEVPRAMPLPALRGEGVGETVPPTPKP